MAGFACLLGRNMRGRHGSGRDALATAGMATRALGRRSLENALDVARFAPHIPVSPAQLEACLRMIETGSTGPRSEGRLGNHACYAEQQNGP